MLMAYTHTKTDRNDCFLTERVDLKIAPMPHHLRGLSYTASGYGERIPTQYMIRVGSKWRRVYCRIFSNVGTLYIGKKYNGSNTVDIDS